MVSDVFIKLIFFTPKSLFKDSRIILNLGQKYSFNPLCKS
jgi:hypothetical protein